MGRLHPRNVRLTKAAWAKLDPAKQVGTADGHTGIALNQHHVGGHRADHGPKHAPGVISDEGLLPETTVDE